MTDNTDQQASEHLTLLEWIARHRYGVALLIGFIAIGMITAPLVFPSVHIVRAIIGGALFGVFCTFCVALPKFFD